MSGIYHIYIAVSHQCLPNYYHHNVWKVQVLQCLMILSARDYMVLYLFMYGKDSTSQEIWLNIVFTGIDPNIDNITAWVTKSRMANMSQIIHILCFKNFTSQIIQQCRLISLEL